MLKFESNSVKYVKRQLKSNFKITELGIRYITEQCFFLIFNKVVKNNVEQKMFKVYIEY